MIKDKNNFARGDIFHIFLPTSDMTSEHSPPDPDYQLHGRHMCICLTSSEDKNVPSNLVGIVPISKATSAVRKGRLTTTHLELLKEEYPFLDIDSYALVFQSRSVGRHWLEDHNYVGNILDFNPDVMKQIGILSLLVSGAYEDVMEFAFEKFNESLFATDKRS